MLRITLDLDDETAALLIADAKANGMSVSDWVTVLIRRHVHGEWPVECRELAGAFPDFPLVEDSPELPEDRSSDIRRRDDR